MLIIKNRKFVITLALGLLLVGGLALALPAVLKMATMQLLEKQGLSASIQNLRLDYLAGALEIEDLQINSADNSGLVLERLQVVLDYPALFEKRLHLRHLDIRGVDIDVERIDDRRLRIAGYEIPHGEGNDEPSGWGFGLDSVSVQESEVHYRDAVLEETLVIGASSVKDVATWMPAQPVNIESHARVKNGLLKLDGQIQPFGKEIILDLAIESENLPLDVFSPYLQQSIHGGTSGQLRVKLLYSASGGTQISVDGSAAVSGLGIQLAAADISAVAESLDWKGGISLELPDAEGTPVIEASGELGSKKLNISQISVDMPLLVLDKLKTEQITVNGLDDIQIKNLNLSGGKGLYLEKNSPEVDWVALNADQLSLKENKELHIQTLRLSGLKARAARTAEGEWNLIRALPAFSSSDDSDEPEPDQKDSLKIVVEKLITDAESEINIEDASVKPVFSTELKDIRLIVNNLDSRAPDKPSPVTVKANVGRYGKLNLAGQVQPFAVSPGLKLNGRLDAANLVPLGGYTGSLIGYGIKQGTVSSDIKLDIGGGDIAANFDLVLNKLKVAGIKGKTGEFQSQMGMTLPAALKLMRDRDDNIRLSLPVSGSLDNPDFGIDEVVQKAIFKAVQMGVLTFYSPLGIVAVADGLFSLATAMRFKPVEFESGSYLLGSGAASYLDEMTALLLKRPEQQVTICGFASQSDKQGMAENIAEQGVRFFGLYKPEADPEAISEKVLIELAQKRVNLVGDYLVTRGMPPEQLIICDSEVDTDAKAKGRVEVSL